MVLVIGPGELPTEYQPHPPLLKMDVAPSPWLLEATEAHQSLFKWFPAIPLLPLSAPSQVGSLGVCGAGGSWPRSAVPPAHLQYYNTQCGPFPVKPGMTLPINI